jgi:hypothetical protein
MWSDQKFMSLSQDAKFLWVFLLTGPQTGIIPGLFRAGRLSMSEELDWEPERFDKGFAELFEKGLAKGSWKHRLVWIPKGIFHNPPDNPNIVKAWRKEFYELPECDLRDEVEEHIIEFLQSLGTKYFQAFTPSRTPSPNPLGNRSENPSPNPFAKGMANQEQEQEVNPSNFSDEKLLVASETLATPDESGEIESVPVADGDPPLALAAHPVEKIKAPPCPPPGFPPCPQQEIIALYAEHLPELTQPRDWKGERAKNLAARWKWVLDDLKHRKKPHDRNAGLDFFSRMFAYVAKSDFLMGRTRDAWNGCGLDWIVKSANFLKIIEGKYDNRVAA